MRYQVLNISERIFYKDIIDIDHWVELNKNEMMEMHKFLHYKRLSDMEIDEEEELEDAEDIYISGQDDAVINCDIFEIVPYERMEVSDCNRCTLYNTDEPVIALFSCPYTDVYFGRFLNIECGRYKRNTEIGLHCTADGIVSIVRCLVEHSFATHLHLYGIDSIDNFYVERDGKCETGLTVESEAPVTIRTLILPEYVTSEVINSFNSIKTGMTHLRTSDSDLCVDILNLVVTDKNTVFDFTGYTMDSISVVGIVPKIVDDLIITLKVSPNQSFAVEYNVRYTAYKGSITVKIEAEDSRTDTYELRGKMFYLRGSDDV